MKVLRQACGATAGRMLALLIAIGADAISARSMELEKRGDYALLMLIATLTAQFCDFGISSSVTYFSAKNHANKSELLDGIYRIWVIECVILIIGFSLFFYIFHPSAIGGLVLFPALCMALFVGSAVAQQSLNGLLVADGLVSKSNILLLLQQLCILAGVTLLSAVNALTPIAALAVQMLSRGLVIAVCLRWLQGVRRKTIPWRLVRTVFKYGFREYTSNLIGIFSYRADQIIVSRLVGSAGLANYAIAASMAERLTIFPAAAATYLMPEVAKSDLRSGWKSTRGILLLNISLMLVGCVILWLVAPFVIKILYSSRYDGVIAPLRIILFGVPFLSLAKLLSSFLAGRGMPEVAVLSSLAAAVTTAGAGILLTMRWGSSGAAAGTVLGYLAAATVLGIAVYKILRPTKPSASSI